MLGKVLLICGMLGTSFLYGQDSLVDKNKENIAILREKIANLESGISPENKNKVLEKEIIIYRDSLIYLVKELEVCAAQKEEIEAESKMMKTEIAKVKTQTLNSTKSNEGPATISKSKGVDNHQSLNSQGSISISESGSNDIYFARDIYKLTKNNEEIVAAFVASLPSNYLFIVIKGHADKTGEKDLNETISRKRANAIKEYLIEEVGVAPNKIMINWFGSDVPSDNGDDKRCELSAYFN